MRSDRRTGALIVSACLLLVACDGRSAPDDVRQDAAAVAAAGPARVIGALPLSPSELAAASAQRRRAPASLSVPTAVLDPLARMTGAPASRGCERIMLIGHPAGGFLSCAD